MNIVWIGLTLGVIWSFVLHLAKALEKHGIETFSRKKSFKEKGKKPLIYLIGYGLNSTSLIWQIIALRYSSASVYSSVFGIGLIVLMLYSHYILKEEIKKIEIFGAFLIIIGTTLIGFLYIIEPSNSEVVNYSRFYTLLIIVLILFSLLIVFSAKTGIAVAFIFGLISGSLGGMDNVFKRIGLKAGFSELFNLQTLPILILSFVVGTLAFFVTQWGFAKGANASHLVPTFNSFYILIPIIFELIIIENASISIEKIISVVIIIVGMFLMNIFKESKELHLET